MSFHFLRLCMLIHCVATARSLTPSHTIHPPDSRPFPVQAPRLFSSPNQSWSDNASLATHVCVHVFTHTLFFVFLSVMTVHLVVFHVQGNATMRASRRRTQMHSRSHTNSYKANVHQFLFFLFSCLLFTFYNVASQARSLCAVSVSASPISFKISALLRVQSSDRA